MSDAMRAMQLDAPGKALLLVSRPMPRPESHDLLLEVRACGVCRTDLHVADGDLKGPKPIVPGHEVVGRVLALGADVSEFRVGDRVGVPGLGGPAGFAPIAAQAGKICATTLYSPASRATAASPAIASRSNGASTGLRESW